MAYAVSPWYARADGHFIFKLFVVNARVTVIYE